MTLRVATWNVNSIRRRLDHLARFAAEQSPDLVCLQETKVDDARFPRDAITAMGFAHILAHGQKGYNGVAIVSRHPFEATGTKAWCGRDDRRHVFARLGCGLEVHNLYVPSGGPEPDPATNEKFDHKLRFLKAMARWARRERLAERPALVVGDLNVAPLPSDVWNHKRLLRSVGHTPIESELLDKARRAGGFIDVPRRFVPPESPLYTWWGYRFPQSLAKDYGWRLDHAWASPALAPRVTAMTVVKATRAWDRPADHVPVMVDLD